MLMTCRKSTMSENLSGVVFCTVALSLVPCFRYTVIREVHLFMYASSAIVHGCHMVCDRVPVWCSGVITKSRYCTLAVSTTRGDPTLCHEYSLRCSAASLHLGILTLTTALCHSSYLVRHSHVHVLAHCISCLALPFSWATPLQYFRCFWWMQI